MGANVSVNSSKIAAGSSQPTAHPATQPSASSPTFQAPPSPSLPSTAAKRAVTAPVAQGPMPPAPGVTAAQKRSIASESWAALQYFRDKMPDIVSRLYTEDGSGQRYAEVLFPGLNASVELRVTPEGLTDAQGGNESLFLDNRAAIESFLLKALRRSYDALKSGAAPGQDIVAASTLAPLVSPDRAQIARESQTRLDGHVNRLTTEYPDAAVKVVQDGEPRVVVPGRAEAGADTPTYRADIVAYVKVTGPASAPDFLAPYQMEEYVRQGNELAGMFSAPTPQTQSDWTRQLLEVDASTPQPKSPAPPKVVKGDLPFDETPY